jgi:glutamyl-tRNA reductase
MLVGILGINHKLADLKLRETLAKTCERRFGAGQSIHNDHSFVLLSTCNRTEIYFCSEDLAETHTYILSVLRSEVQGDFDQKLYSYFGYDCFLHLARVTAGLDSAIIAETEIQGQVKNAYENALQYRLIPKELHFLFQKVLKIGKKVRSDLPFQRGTPSLEQAIYGVGEKFFENPRNTNILFIGASDINYKILRYFKSKNCNKLTLCNRSLEHAKKITDHFALKLLPWNEFESWHEHDWIILATKFPDYLIKNSLFLNSSNCNKLIMDLSVPRNVEPTVGFQPGIHLMNIDEINDLLHHRMEKMTHTLLKTEEVIVRETKTQVITFKKKERYSQNLLPITA